MSDSNRGEPNGEPELELEDDGDEGFDNDQGDNLDDADLDDADGPDGSSERGLNNADDPSEEQREQEVRPLTRSQARVQTAVNEAKAAREEAADLRRQMEAQQNGRQSSEAAERERQALENMDPYERLEYQSRKSESNMEAKLARIEFTMADSADRTDFASKVARMPALASVADEVETALVAMRKSGTTAPRETIAKYLLGERALTRGAANKTRATKAGTARIDRAAGKPTGARSDVRREAPGGDSKKARFERLVDKQI